MKLSTILNKLKMDNYKNTAWCFDKEEAEVKNFKWVSDGINDKLDYILEGDEIIEKFAEVGFDKNDSENKAINYFNAYILQFLDEEEVAGEFSCGCTQENRNENHKVSEIYVANTSEKYVVEVEVCTLTNEVVEVNADMIDGEYKTLSTIQDFVWTIDTKKYNTVEKVKELVEAEYYMYVVKNKIMPCECDSIENEHLFKGYNVHCGYGDILGIEFDICNYTANVTAIYTDRNDSINEENITILENIVEKIIMNKFSCEQIVEMLEEVYGYELEELY